MTGVGQIAEGQLSSPRGRKQPCSGCHSRSLMALRLATTWHKRGSCFIYARARGRNGGFGCFGTLRPRDSASDAYPHGNRCIGAVERRAAMHQRVSSPTLKAAQVLLAEARAFFHLLLRQTFRPPQAREVSSNQFAHVHARDVRDLHTLSLSTIIVDQPDWLIASSSARFT